jgi:hypothetical protein
MTCGIIVKVGSVGPVVIVVSGVRREGEVFAATSGEVVSGQSGSDSVAAAVTW